MWLTLKGTKLKPYEYDNLPRKASRAVQKADEHILKQEYIRNKSKSAWTVEYCQKKKKNGGASLYIYIV